jgi:hypothetical protein
MAVPMVQAQRKERDVQETAREKQLCILPHQNRVVTTMIQNILEGDKCINSKSAL